MLQEKALKDLVKFLDKTLNQKRIDYLFTILTNLKTKFPDENKISTHLHNSKNILRILNESDIPKHSPKSRLQSHINKLSLLRNSRVDNTFEAPQINEEIGVKKVIQDILDNPLDDSYQTNKKESPSSVKGNKRLDIKKISNFKII